MRSISTLLKGAKNRLDLKEPFVTLLEIGKTGWWRLDYKSATSDFSEESTLAGTTAGARILFVEQKSATSGYLIIDEVTGDGVFLNGTVVTDAHGGSAVVNGTLDTTLTAGCTFRFVRNTEDVDWAGHTYEAFPFEMDAAQYGQEKLPTLELKIANILRMPEAWLRKGEGFLGEEVRLLVVWNGGT